MDSFDKKAKKILEGHYNNIVGKNKELQESRLAICKDCPIHHNNWCITKRGGCGCYLPAKAAYEDEHCPKDKW